MVLKEIENKLGDICLYVNTRVSIKLHLNGSEHVHCLGNTSDWQWLESVLRWYPINLLIAIEAISRHNLVTTISGHPSRIRSHPSSHLGQCIQPSDGRDTISTIPPENCPRLLSCHWRWLEPPPRSWVTVSRSQPQCPTQVIGALGPLTSGFRLDWVTDNHVVGVGNIISPEHWRHWQSSFEQASHSFLSLRRWPFTSTHCITINNIDSQVPLTILASSIDLSNCLKSNHKSQRRLILSGACSWSRLQFLLHFGLWHVLPF